MQTMTNQEQKQNTVLQCFQITLQLSLEILEAFSATEISPPKNTFIGSTLMISAINQ